MEKRNIKKLGVETSLLGFGCMRFPLNEDGTIDEVESELITARNKKLNIVSDKMKLDNIYQVLIHFDDLYQLMNEDEKRDLLAILISEIHIYDERQPNGQWLNEIVFNLPIIDKDRVTISCDNGNHVETVCLLAKLNVDEHIYVDLEMSELDITSAEKKASYEQIKSYVLENTGLKVSHLNIAQIKRKHGIIERDCYNLPKSENSRQPNCTVEKEKAIVDALKYFKMI